MSQQFKFTDPGEGLQEAEILEVHVSDGDSVSDGDTVLTVETDKANTDIPAPFTGTVDEVRVAEGDMVQIGDVLMTYSEGGGSGGDQKQAESSTDENSEEGNRDESADKKSDEDGSDGSEDEKSDEDSSDEKTSGEAQAEKSGSEEKQDRSEQSRQNDSESEQESKSGERRESRESGDKSTGSKTDSGGGKRQPVPAAPSTRRLAREKGVDLHDVEPSGPDGRVTAEDVEAAAEAEKGEKSQSKDQSKKAKAKDKTEAGTSPLVPGGAPPALPDFSQWGEIERESLRSIRRATAQNMARSWGQIPHVYHQDIADVTALERFRRNHQPDQGKLTLTVLVMKALTSVLKRFPRFNASLDVANQEIVYKHYCHMGLAVATDRGLLVPVIRDVDRKSVSELAVESADIARKTRNGELSRADMQGGSITVTNPGPLGGSSLTPLINHPQIAILGMGAARLDPVVSGDLDDYTIEPRLRLPLVLGFDHRVNDGADAARFVTTLIETLADPESLLLAV